MSQKIRALIATELPALRQEMMQVLVAESDIEVVAQVSSGAEMIKLAAELAPNVVVMDLVMDGGGVPALDRIAAAGPDTRVVVLVMPDGLQHLRRALAAGGLGYVMSRQALPELPAVMREINSGGGYPRPPAAETRQTTTRRVHQSLSRREQEVLQGVAYGYTNREIAERLGLSIKSVETYRFRVAEKLGFSNRAGLVRFALNAGLLRVDSDGLPSPLSDYPERIAVPEPPPDQPSPLST